MIVTVVCCSGVGVDGAITGLADLRTGINACVPLAKPFGGDLEGKLTPLKLDMMYSKFSIKVESQLQKG